MWFGQVAPGIVVEMVFSLDSRTLYTCDAMARIFAWDTAARTGRKLVPHNDPDEHNHPIPTPDGRHLLCHGGYQVVLRDAATGRVVSQTPFPAELRVRPKYVSHDTRHLFMLTEDRTAILRWDWAARSAPEPINWRWPADLDVPFGFTVTRNQQTLAVHALGHAICLFDATTGAELTRLTDAFPSDKLAFNPTGDRLISFGPMGMAAFDLRMGQRLWHRENTDGWMHEVVIHPTRPLLGYANHTGRQNTEARFLDLNTGEPVALPDPGFKSAYSVAFSPDGLTCAVGSHHRQFAVFDVDF